MATNPTDMIHAPEKDNWRDTILAGLANYIDAGSIVAGAAALALWQETYTLSNDFVGLIVQQP